jgi:hypothetical protein
MGPHPVTPAWAARSKRRNPRRLNWPGERRPHSVHGECTCLMMNVGAARCARRLVPPPCRIRLFLAAPGARRTDHRQLRTNDVLSIGREPAVTRVSECRSRAPARRVRRHALRHQRQSHTSPSASAAASRRSQFGSPAAPERPCLEPSVTLRQSHSVSHTPSVTLRQSHSVSHTPSVTLSGAAIELHRAASIRGEEQLEAVQRQRWIEIFIRRIHHI